MRTKAKSTIDDTDIGELKKRAAKPGQIDNSKEKNENDGKKLSKYWKTN